MTAFGGYFTSFITKRTETNPSLKDKIIKGLDIKTKYVLCEIINKKFHVVINPEQDFYEQLHRFIDDHFVDNNSIEECILEIINSIERKCGDEMFNLISRLMFKSEISIDKYAEFDTKIDTKVNGIDELKKFIDNIETIKDNIEELEDPKFTIVCFGDNDSSISESKKTLKRLFKSPEDSLKSVGGYNDMYDLYCYEIGNVRLHVYYINKLIYYHETVRRRREMMKIVNGGVDLYLWFFDISSIVNEEIKQKMKQFKNTFKYTKEKFIKLLQDSTVVLYNANTNPPICDYPNFHELSDFEKEEVILKEWTAVKNNKIKMYHEFFKNLPDKKNDVPTIDSYTLVENRLTNKNKFVEDDHGLIDGGGSYELLMKILLQKTERKQTLFYLMLGKYIDKEITKFNKRISLLSKVYPFVEFDL